MERKILEKKLSFSNGGWKTRDLTGLYQTLCFSTADLLTGHQNVLLNTMAAKTLKNMYTEEATDWVRCMYRAQALADEYVELYEMVTSMAQKHLRQEDYQTIDEGLKCGPKKLPPVNQDLMLDLYKFELPALFVDKSFTHGAHFCTASTQTPLSQREIREKTPLKAKELSQSATSYTEKEPSHSNLTTASAHDIASVKTEKPRKKSGKKTTQKKACQKSPSKDMIQCLKEVHPLKKTESLSMFSVLPSIPATNNITLEGDTQQSAVSPHAANKTAKMPKLKSVHVGSKRGKAGESAFEEVEHKPDIWCNFPKLKPIACRSKVDPWKPIFDK